MRYVIGLALAAAFATPALAVGRLADINIVDRDSGRTLPTYRHGGDVWVAGRPGAHYAIQIHSQDGRRLLAVTSVDGVNVLTGETAGVDQSGYVFDSWASYGIAGWRKSDSQIAAFTFTSIPNSYAARTGRPANVGIIGLALFRERVEQVYQPMERLDMPVPAPKMEVPPAAMDSAAGAPSAPAEESLARKESRAAGSLKDEAQRQRAQSLGTGHGRREYSPITKVEFERESSRPDEVIRIRYDSYENLVAMGVIRRPPPRRPDPFPDAQSGYVPDP